MTRPLGLSGTTTTSTPNKTAYTATIVLYTITINTSRNSVCANTWEMNYSNIYRSSKMHKCKNTKKSLYVFPSIINGGIIRPESLIMGLNACRK